MQRTGVLKEKLVEIIKTDIMNDISSELMERFDEKIVAFEDEDDPMRPSLCKEEFREFLEETIEGSIKIEKDGISFGIGDSRKLGLEEELSDETTDCLKIIGTILSGISGNYILVTEDMARQMFPGRRNYDLGRTGEAYIMRVEEYNAGMARYGWPPQPVWKFSNFEGIPDFFDIDVGQYIEKYMARLVEALK